MTQVISGQAYTLENSTQLTRPGLGLFMQPDANAGATDMAHFSARKHFRSLRIPNASGPLDYDAGAACCDAKPCMSGGASAINMGTSNGAVARKHHDFGLIDPLTNFISTTGELTIGSGKFGMPSLGKARIEPQMSVPHAIHSIRTHPQAIEELKRTQEGDTPPELAWNSKKVTDVVMRSRLGGWTSAYDMRAAQAKSAAAANTNPYRLRDIFPHMKINYHDEAERDELANRYRFTTSTQQMYAQVNWDSKLPRKLHAPVTTFEHGKSDPLNKQGESVTGQRPQIWQTIAGSVWDRVQARTPNFNNDKVSFTAPCKRSGHLPGYSGHVTGANKECMDDAGERFVPLTVLRTQQPKEPAANYKPNIPGYTGHTHYFQTNSVSHYDTHGRPYTTTAAFHREMPAVNQNHPEIPSLAGDFARIQTKVAPQNPFDNVTRTSDIDTNHSLDHVLHPHVTAKATNHADYLLGTRDERLRSILKKNLS